MGGSGVDGPTRRVRNWLVNGMNVTKQTVPSSMREILDRHVSQRPDAEAFSAPGRSPLSYRDLLDLVEEFGTHLRRLGISSTDRVAIVIANGPEMATAFVAVATVSAAVYRLRVLGQWFDGIRFYAAASSPRRSRRTWAGLR